MLGPHSPAVIYERNHHLRARPDRILLTSRHRSSIQMLPNCTAESVLNSMRGGANRGST